MNYNVLYDTSDYIVESYGNGLAYDFKNKITGQSLFFQGDDAQVFRQSLIEVFDTFSYLYDNEVLDKLWYNTL